MGLIVALGLGMSLLGVLSQAMNGDDLKTTAIARGVVLTQYHAWAAVLGGEDYEWMTWPGRIFRVGLLWLVFYSTSTYTANLAAFFTQSPFEVHGPQDMAALQSTVVHVRDESFASVFSPYVKGIEYAYGSLTPGPLGLIDGITPHIPIAYEWLKEQLRSGKALAVLVPESLVHIWEVENCGSFAVAKSIAFAEFQWELKFRLEDIRLANDWKAAQAWYKGTPEYTEMLKRHLRVGLSCDGGGDEELAKVSLESQSGVFIIAGGICAIALCVAMAELMMRRLGKATPKDSEGLKTQVSGGGHPHLTEGEMLRDIMQSLSELRRQSAAEPLPKPRNGDARGDARLSMTTGSGGAISGLADSRPANGATNGGMANGRRGLRMSPELDALFNAAHAT